MAWTPDDPSSREVRADVRPGVRVVGMISENVPRPITRGRVVAWCGSPSRIESNADGGRTQPIWWIDTVPVREDGSFEFASLPTGYLAQMYAFANDFISSQPTDAAYKICCDWFASQDQERQRNHFFRYGQVLRLAGAKSRITLDMEPAGQVRVRCVDIISGEPVAGVIVGSSPNQYTVGGGSTIFCQGQRTLDCLLEGERILKRWRQDSPYSAVTDINGEALIQNLPQGHQSFVARNDRWESRQGRHGVEAVPGKIVRLNITLQRIP
jgi:hypothetical protein